MLGIKSGVTICKVSALPAVLSLLALPHLEPTQLLLFLLLGFSLTPNQPDEGGWLSKPGPRNYSPNRWALNSQTHL